MKTKKSIYSKKERHKAYKRALEEVENPEGWGYICLAIEYIKSCSGHDPKEMTELMLFAPLDEDGELVDSRDPWFGQPTPKNQRRRKIVLDLCILMTE